MSQIQLSVTGFLCVELVAGALLALWVAVRFPSFGPKAIRTAMVLVLGALCLIRVATLGVTPLLHLPYGGYVALFGCVLPTFFVVYIATAWWMRLLVAQFGGSGGGGGHRVPASSRF